MFGIKSQLRRSLAAWLLLGGQISSGNGRSQFNEAHACMWKQALELGIREAKVALTAQC